MKNSYLLVGLVLAASSAQAAEVEIEMKNKTFTLSDRPVMDITVKVGDKISFRNGDPFVHNVFSLTDPGSFDLGSYPKGQAKGAEFQSEGIHEVECAIHPEMKLHVKVTK